MIHRTPFFLPWLYPKLVWRIPNEKTIYLTFDDGPVPGATEFVLHTLDRFSAKATFFCIGDNVKKHPGLFNKIIDEGHAIGNHTFNHLNGWKNKNNRYVENVMHCHDEMAKHLPPGRITKLFRPPYGRITRQQIDMLNNYQVIMWDVLSMDYNKNLAPHTCLLNTVDATRSGSIIVFHDSIKAERNMTFALPRFIEHFKERDYSFKTITG